MNTYLSNIGEVTGFRFESSVPTVLGRARNVVRTEHSVSCRIQFNEEGWEFLRKTLARTVKIELPEPNASLRKGRVVTMRFNGWCEQRDVTGLLYHIRKPYKDSEARIYYIREEFSGIPKAI